MTAEIQNSTQDFAPLTLGTSLRERRFTWCRVVESSHPGHQVLGRHAHEHPDVTIVGIGGFDTGVGRELLECRPGDLLYLPGEFDHTNRYSPRGARTSIIEFDSFAGHCDSLGIQLPNRALVASPAVVFSLASRIGREFFDSAGESSLALEELVLCLTATIGKSPLPSRTEMRPKWLSSVVDFINESFMESFDLAYLAQFSGVHAMHVSRVFRRRMGCSIGQYLRTLRIEAAARQLETSDRPIGEIACAVGFFDQPHLTRFFKRQMGITPRAYRQLRRGRDEVTYSKRQGAE